MITLSKKPGAGAQVDSSNAALSFLRIEAGALAALALRHERNPAPLAAAFERIETALAAGRRIVTTGIGKSGLIAQKVAATLRSTGTSAHYMHPSEAMHGDFALLSAGDILLALSYSGETAELLQLLPALKRLDVPILVLTGCPDSTLGRAAAVTLDCSVAAEACPHNLAPTASTTVMLALGDAIALELSRNAGFTPQNFADLHPGGRLGNRLARVRDLMHYGDAMPSVSLATPMPQLIHEMSSKKLGMTTVLAGLESSEPGTLLGIVSDGDLRRLLESAAETPQDQAAIFTRTAGQIMNRTPRTIAPEALASGALTIMEEKKITSLIVVDEHNKALGVVHLHDLYA